MIEDDAFSEFSKDSLSSLKNTKSDFVDIFKKSLKDQLALVDIKISNKDEEIKRAWFFKNKNGKICLVFKYVNFVFDFTGGGEGKEVIVVDNYEDVEKALKIAEKVASSSPYKERIKAARDEMLVKREKSRENNKIKKAEAAKKEADVSEEK